MTETKGSEKWVVYGYRPLDPKDITSGPLHQPGDTVTQHVFAGMYGYYDDLNSAGDAIIHLRYMRDSGLAPGLEGLRFFYEMTTKRAYSAIRPTGWLPAFQFRREDYLPGGSRCGL